MSELWYSHVIVIIVLYNGPVPVTLAKYDLLTPKSASFLELPSLSLTKLTAKDQPSAVLKFDVIQPRLRKMVQRTHNTSRLV